MKQNPFSLYDFLGYFIPGALITYVVFLFKTTQSIHDFVSTATQETQFQFDKFLLFTIISYSVGHLVNFLSSITIERYANWKYNYPSKYLLDFESNHRFWKGNKIIVLWKVILSILILPIRVYDYILGNKLNFKAFYTKKLDGMLASIIKEKGLILLDKLTPEAYKDIRLNDFHRIFAHYTYENSKNHQSKLSNYVALYGFLRSLTFICNLIFWSLVFITFSKYDSELELFCNGNILKSYFYMILVFSLISYIFFMAFMKFYRRYTLEVLMLVAIDKDLVNRPDQVSQQNIEDKK